MKLSLLLPISYRTPSGPEGFCVNCSFMHIFNYDYYSKLCLTCTLTILD